MTPSMFPNDIDHPMIEKNAETNPSHPNNTAPVCRLKQKNPSSAILSDIRLISEAEKNLKCEQQVHAHQCYTDKNSEWFTPIWFSWRKNSDHKQNLFSNDLLVDFDSNPIINLIAYQWELYLPLKLKKKLNLTLINSKLSLDWENSISDRMQRRRKSETLFVYLF